MHNINQAKKKKNHNIFQWVRIPKSIPALILWAFDVCQSPCRWACPEDRGILSSLSFVVWGAMYSTVSMGSCLATLGSYSIGFGDASSFGALYYCTLKIRETIIINYFNNSIHWTLKWFYFSGLSTTRWNHIFKPEYVEDISDYPIQSIF